MTKLMKRMQRQTALATGALVLMAGSAMADQVIADDLIVQGSICAGLDCVNGESFGFDTLRLKENNLRIKAQDTSSSASFPSADWQITFNDSSNGGVNKFSIDDIDGGRTPFTIEQSAPSNSLYVDDAGRIGVGTGTPVVELHVVDGDSPTLRLEQDGSSGFTPQTWDVASNEANFFVRDATNGSQLPFRIAPGADSNSVSIANDNDVGMGIQNPEANTSLHIRRSDGTAKVLIEEVGAEGNRGLLELRNNGRVWISLVDTSGSRTDWNLQNNGGKLRMTNADFAGEEFVLDADGDLTISGSLTTGGTGTCSGTPCDAVFDPAIYSVPSIAEHAESMWENKYLPAVGPTLPGQSIDLTKKVLNMLNELEHAHIYIEQLHTQISDMEQRLDAVEADKG